MVSTDKLLLPGLLYTPSKPTKKVAVWLHGMGDNGIFYNPDRMNTLGQALTSRDIAFLAFNNRGAHNRKSLRILDDRLPEEEQRYLGGTHHERIEECVADIDGAVAFLQARKFTEFYLVGHSTGANKICTYHVRTAQNPFCKYVLAGSGDDSGIFFSELGARKFKQALQYAHRAMTAGQPLKIMPRYTGLYPFSAQAAADILDPDGAYNSFPFYEATTKRLGTKPLFAEYRKIDRPTLVLYGGDDEYTYTAGGTAAALDILRGYTGRSQLKQTEFAMVNGADHSFHGYEREFANIVATWLEGKQ